MKKLIAVLLFVACALLTTAWTQESQSVLKQGTWQFGLWTGGGSGLGAASDYKFFNSGVRVGRVLTPDLFRNWAHGNFELAADVVPVYLIWQPVDFLERDPGSGALRIRTDRQRVYSFSMNPVVLKWNFTGKRRVAPFIEADGGIIFSRTEVPAGDTSSFNFSPGGALGVHIFTSDKRALTLSGHVLHISNASIGDHNPGINAILQFRVEYSFFK